MIKKVAFFKRHNKLSQEHTRAYKPRAIYETQAYPPRALRDNKLITRTFGGRGTGCCSFLDRGQLPINPSKLSILFTTPDATPDATPEQQPLQCAGKGAQHGPTGKEPTGKGARPGSQATRSGPIRARGPDAMAEAIHQPKLP